MDTGRIGNSLLAALTAKLEATQAKLQDQKYDGLTKDDGVGDLLYTTITSYFAELDLKDEVTAKATKVLRYRIASVGTFSLALSVNDVFGVPLSASTGGMTMDVDRVMQTVFSKDGGMDRTKQYMISSGINSSVLEYAVPERLYSQLGSPTAISAVKALNMANNQGIPIYTVNQLNIASILPKLKVSEDVKNDIINSVNAGKTVTVPEENISFNGWIGCGYIVMDPITGAGAYMIDGGLHGVWMIIILISLTLLLFGGGLIAGFIVCSVGAIAAGIGAVLVGLAIGLPLSQLLSPDSKKQLQDLFTPALEAGMEILAAMELPVAMTVAFLTWIAMKMKEVIDEIVGYSYRDRKIYYLAANKTKSVEV